MTNGTTGTNGTRPALGARELSFIVAFWAFVAALSAATRLLDPRFPDLPEQMADAIVRVSLVEYALWAVLSAAIFWVVGRLSGEGGRQMGRVLLLAALGIGVAMAVDAVLASVREGMLDEARRAMRAAGGGGGGRSFGWGGGPRGPRGPAPGFGFLDDLMVYFAVLGAAVAREYFARYQARREETVRLQAESAELHAQLAEARLDALRRQLDPHFLFNTLHAISSLVERDPRGVRKMISRLSDLLRYSLEGKPAQETPLEREMEVLRRYVEIMEIRFQGRLTVETTVEDGVRDALVPSLILQPLVENALKHGVSRIEGEGQGRIEIGARRVGGDVVLSVRDNGPGPNAAAPAAEAPTSSGASIVPVSAGGLGLRNTRDRLAQLYGPGASLALRPAEAGGTVAEIRLPYRRAQGVAA